MIDRWDGRAYYVNELVHTVGAMQCDLLQLQSLMDIMLNMTDITAEVMHERQMG